MIGNLINGKNNSTADCNIWLAPLLSDVEKIEKGRPNVILLEYSKPTRISGINFYNYVKTPSRGVREIEVFLDSFLLYRVNTCLFRAISDKTMPPASTLQSISQKNRHYSKP